MAMDFGVSFNPANRDQQQPGGPGGQTGPSQTPIQDAIKTLSLRIPTFRGPGFAPQPLLQSAGSGGVLAGAAGGPGGMPGGGGLPGGLQQLLEQLFGQGQSGAGVPTPNFTPGSGPAIPSNPEGFTFNPLPQGPSYQPHVPNIKDNGGMDVTQASNRRF